MKTTLAKLKNRTTEKLSLFAAAVMAAAPLVHTDARWIAAIFGFTIFFVVTVMIFGWIEVREGSWLRRKGREFFLAWMWFGYGVVFNQGFFDAVELAIDRTAFGTDDPSTWVGYIWIAALIGLGAWLAWSYRRQSE